MYLKRLEIKGFKSFSKTTVLDFLSFKDKHFSITAVVGPNGAGKSNIVDAIRWVMGEQSLKNLRGKKSEDIIFAGSETKGQLGAAEVKMTLDNSDGKLLADFDEITIARRLYRSGEGEYLINNNLVRLLDIHLLLAKAQFAQASYSIVGQGMIDHLLTVNSVDRKDFLDEASGIKEFKIKQHQAELKLTRTRENIEQAKRLMQEIEPRLKLLSRQVKKLEKRQEMELKLRESQETHYASLYLANRNELEEWTAKLTQVEKEYRFLFANLQEVQEELASLARASSRQQVFNNLQNNFQTIVREKNELERMLAIKQGQSQTEYRRVGQENIGWLEKKLADLKNQNDSLSEKIKSLNLEETQINQHLVKLKETTEKLLAAKTACQIRVSQLEKQIIDGQSEQNFRRYSGLLAVQAVLENREKFGQIYGLLAELGEVEEKYRLALEVAAGSYLSAVVVEDEEVARLAIEFLRQNRLGYATFLPLNKITTSEFVLPAEIVSHPGAYGLAVDLISYRSKLASVFSFIFKQTLIVDDLVVARKIGIGRARMVTLAGDLVDKSGVMRGGYRSINRNMLGFSHKLRLDQDSLAGYNIQINSEKNELSALEQQLEKNRLAILEQEGKKETARIKAEMLVGEQNSLLRETAALEQELKLSQIKPEDQGDFLVQLQKDKDSLAIKIKEKDTEINKLAEEIEAFNSDEERKKQHVFSLQDKMQKQQNELNDIMTARNDLRIEIARLETKQESIVEEVKLEMSVTIDSIIARDIPTVQKDQVSELFSNIQKIKYQLSLIGGIDDEVISEYEQTREKYVFLSGQINDLQKAIIDLEKMITELDEVMKKKSEVAFKKIKQEFSRYVKILFGGGSAEMKEIYGEEETAEEAISRDLNLINSAGATKFIDSEIDNPQKIESKRKKIVTGIDIIVSPPGKKIKYLNSLSGGERTLVSIALICAVLSYNPAPFVVLDEVEAALDEVNTMRFAKIISELSSRSQFVIITHNRVTMHSADALYGVTMGPDGISQLLSVKLAQAEAMSTENSDER